MLIVPPAILDMLRLQAGAAVALVVDEGRPIVEPQRRRDTLDELLAQCDPAAAAAPEDREWLDSGPSGRELLQWSAVTSTSFRSIQAPATSGRGAALYSWYRLTPSIG